LPRSAALGYAAPGLSFSICFMVLQVAFIHVFCIYVLVSAFATILLLVAAVSHFKATPVAMMKGYCTGADVMQG
jgi:hypothetical protein